MFEYVVWRDDVDFLKDRLWIEDAVLTPRDIGVHRKTEGTCAIMEAPSYNIPYPVEVHDYLWSYDTVF